MFSLCFSLGISAFITWSVFVYTTRFLAQPNIYTRIPEPTVGKALLKARGMFVDGYWYWISVGALLGFSLLFNICFIAALTYLDRKLLLILTFIFLFPSSKGFGHGIIIHQSELGII